MSVELPKDWTREDDELFVYKDGTRIHKTTYNSKQGWFMIPVDLDETVIEYADTEEGRDLAFDEFTQKVDDEKARKKAERAARAKKKKEDAAAAKEAAEEDAAEAADEAGEESSGNDDPPSNSNE